MGTFHNDCDVVIRKRKTVENEMRKELASRAVRSQTETSVHVLYVRVYHGWHDFRDAKW